MVSKVSVVLVAALAAACSAQNIPEVAVSAGQFSTLVDFLTQADLVDTLNGPGPFTVFAPTDEAFAKLPAETVEALNADPELLRNVLLYHVVSGSVAAADLSDDLSVDSVAGAPLRVDLCGNTALINGKRIIATDTPADNGLIHAIDEVIFPLAEDSIPGVASSDPELSTLVDALQQADLVEALAGEGPFTVFAPTNDAFAEIPEADLAALLADPEQLGTVLRRHVTSGSVFSGCLNNAMLTTLDGEDISDRVSCGYGHHGMRRNGRRRSKRYAGRNKGSRRMMGSSNAQMASKAKVVSGDIVATNGVIHKIDRVLL